jgi:hypothetical protein
VPDGFLTDTIAQHTTCAADTPKDPSAINRSGAEPIQKFDVNPIGHRDCPDMTSFANKIHNGPVFLSLLQILDSETGGLMASQPAREEKS